MTLHLIRWLTRHWFTFALCFIALATLADGYGILAALGNWIKNHHGPDFVIVCVFLLSGFALSPQQLKGGLLDIQGMLLALAVIFIAAPLAAVLFSRAPMDMGIHIGLIIVAVMPSTLSSGVIMTAAAGGNAAHALVTTVLANILSVFTIPYALSYLLALVGKSASVSIDKAAIMLKIGTLVVLPLIAGMILRRLLSSLHDRLEDKINPANQILILLMVWIAMSQTRSLLVGSGLTVGLIVVVSFLYHGLLLICAGSLIRVSGREPGHRESILFIGGQKTLTLSILLQMSLFPQYPLALLVCVLHHIVHIIMDGFLVERLARSSSAERP